MPGTDKTIYMIDGWAYEVPDVERRAQAVKRLRTLWSRCATPSFMYPFARKDAAGSFATEMADATIVGRSPETDQEAAALFEKGVEGRIYALWVKPASNLASRPSEPQIDILGKRPGETRLHHIQSCSFRALVSEQVDASFEDPSILYRIRAGQSETHLVHGDHLEQIHLFVDRARMAAQGFYDPTEARHILDQLESAQQDHENRTAPSAPTP